MTDPRQPAHDAVFAHIGTLAAVLPADTAHRNAMIWRAVHVALGAGADNSRTSPDNPVASSVALENADICDSYALPTESSESGICARCGMYDWKHRGELARLRAEVARMREAGDHHIETANRLRAEVQRDRDQQAAVLAEVLATFAHKTHPGYSAVQSRHVPVEHLKRWLAVVAPTVERPWWETVAQYEEAVVDATHHVLELKAALARVRAVVDRLTVGAPWAANQADVAARLQAALDGDPS